MYDYAYRQMPTSTVVWIKVWVTIALLLLYYLTNPYVVSAQLDEDFPRLEIPSSFNPVGSGARALGMGGAFIAIADDATAASWNPGGLIQLETPEVSLVGAYTDRSEDLDFGTNPEASGSEGITTKNVNYLSAAYPFTWLGRNMIVSVNYQHLFDFYRDWDFSLFNQSPGISVEQDVSHTSEGSLSAIGMAAAIQVTPRISLGMTLNFWQDGLYQNQWETEDINKWSDPSVPTTLKTIDYTRYEFSGFNYNLGMLWTITHNVTIGAVYKAPFTADIDRHEETFEFVDDMGAPSDYFEVDKDQELDMPMSYGIGLSYRFSDSLSAALDIYRTEWDDFIYTDEDGNETSAISFKPADESDIEPTTQIRFGVEYLIIMDRSVIPLRGGCFYDPAPAEGSPDHYHGISLGSGIATGNIVIDLAYQYRFGNGVYDYMNENLDFSADVKEHIMYASIIYHF